MLASTHIAPSALLWGILYLAKGDHRVRLVATEKVQPPVTHSSSYYAYHGQHAVRDGQGSMSISASHVTQGTPPEVRGTFNETTTNVQSLSYTCRVIGKIETQTRVLKKPTFRGQVIFIPVSPMVLHRIQQRFMGNGPVVVYRPLTARPPAIPDPVGRASHALGYCFLASISLEADAGYGHTVIHM